MDITTTLILGVVGLACWGVTSLFLAIYADRKDKRPVSPYFGRKDNE